MSGDYLLAIHIGPVQEFIAAARRTSDLQAGSELLVRLVGATARAIHEALAGDGALIFPADHTKAGANKLLVEVRAGDPRELAEKGRDAAQTALRLAWMKALDELPPHGSRNSVRAHETLALGQIDHFLEYYAAWTPMGEDYAAARRDVELLLAGRKALRDFERPSSPAGRSKSPLDPSRDCVVDCEKSGAVVAACRDHPLWLKNRETLDAVSLLKRVAGVQGRAEPVPSTSLMAVRSILPSAREKATAAVARLESLAKKAGSAVDLGDLFFPGRCDESDLGKLTAEEQADIPIQRGAVLKSLDLSEAPPYYAILVADGDRVGALLGELTEDQNDPEIHRRFFDALGGFEARVRRLVPKYDGHLVYSGGDDVLALLPSNKALVCAYALREAFPDSLKGLVPRGALPTLSAGLVWVHHMESLHQAIEYARAAERCAKRTRNALAVAYHPRGGAPVATQQNWDDAGGLKDWQDWTTDFAAPPGQGLSRGAPYELQRLAREFARAPVRGETGLWDLLPEDRRTERLRAEAHRILRRKEGGSREPLPATIGDPDGLMNFSNRLVVARFLAGYERGD